MERDRYRQRGRDREGQRETDKPYCIKWWRNPPWFYVCLSKSMSIEGEVKRGRDRDRQRVRDRQG